jgi:hypothetical protein
MAGYIGGLAHASPRSPLPPAQSGAQNSPAMFCSRQPYYYSTDGGLTAAPCPGPRPPGAYETTRERLVFRAFRQQLSTNANFDNFTLSVPLPQGTTFLRGLSPRFNLK